MRLMVAILVALTVIGCAGDTSSGTLSCPAPGETGCASLDEVYQASAGKSTSAPNAETLRRVRQVAGRVEPELRHPRVVRVWLAPWQDEEGDLHDHQYLYLVIEPPRWDVDHLHIPPRP